MTKDFTVASADQLRGLDHEKIPGVAEEAFGTPAMKEPPSRQVEDTLKSVRFTPSTIKRVEGDDSPGTELFTHSRHASWSTNSPVSAIPESLPTFQAPYETELLRPVRYNEAPQFLNNDVEDLFPVASDERTIAALEGRPLPPPPIDHQHDAPKTKGDLSLDTSRHLRSHSKSSSTSSRRGRKQQDDLYFTPTDYTKSKIWFSSPKGSPTLPQNFVGGESPPSAASEIPNIAPRKLTSPSHVPKRRETLKITAAQLDQLVTALAKSRMVQKHVRKYWWDAEDIPDDETVATMETVDTPTLTTASTLYSRQNENFIGEVSTPEPVEQLQSDAKTTRAVDFTSPSSSSYALTDPKIHGSPIRFLSQTHRHLGSIGTCSFLSVPYGTDVESTLHIHPTPLKITLQNVFQTVDRKTGKKTYLLASSTDVTRNFIHAALAEFASAIDKSIDEIEITPSPTSNLPTNSPEIDWVALADTLQATSHSTDLVETTLSSFHSSLTSESCTMSTLSLLSHLDRTKDSHTDFLILKPTAFHPNGTPSSIKLPWCSQRLYHDWYQTEAGHGKSEAAERFKAELVGEVAKKKEEFVAKVKWEETVMVVCCVPMWGGGGEEDVVWVCFVKGEWDLSPKE